MYGFRAKASGVAFSKTEVQPEFIVSLLNPPPSKGTYRSSFHILVSINLANTVCPTLVTPCDLVSPNLQAH